MSVFWHMYLAAALLSVLATAGVMRLAARLNALDMPGAGRVHRRAVPRIGGLAIAATLYAAVLLLAVLPQKASAPWRALGPAEISLLGGGLLVLLAGLVDDLRGLKARYKLLAQLAAAVAACAGGIRLETLHLPGLLWLELGWASWPITIFWIVGLTNAMNLIDGTDGLAAGVSAIACGVILALSVAAGQFVLALLALVLLGSLSGFLAFNFPPARIFMGDCGAMFLGFVLSAFSVLCAKQTGSTVGLMLPGLAMGVPILDTLFSILRRLWNHRSPFRPDCAHVHHRLLGTGLSQRRAALLVYAATILAVAVGAFMLRTRGSGTLCLAGSGVVALLLVFLRAEQPSPDSASGRRCTLFCPPSGAQPVLEQWLPHFREARTFDSWWNVMCDVADGMGFAQLSLPVTNRNGSVRKLLWRRNGDPHGHRQMVRSVTLVRHSRPGPPLEIEVYVPVSESLESAGRQVARFGEMIEQHSLADLPSRRKIA